MDAGKGDCRPDGVVLQALKQPSGVGVQVGDADAVVRHRGGVSYVAGQILGVVVVDAIAHIGEYVKGIRAEAQEYSFDHMSMLEKPITTELV